MNEIENAKEAQDKIIKKALTDPAFKKALLADSSAAIEKELGAKLPAGIKVKVVEDTASVVHLVLPAVPGKGELSDMALGKVSGGASLTEKIHCSSSTVDQCQVL